MSFRVVEPLALRVGIDGRYAGRDQSEGVPQENTGGLVVSAVPGLAWNVAGPIWLLAQVQIPFATSLFEQQTVGVTATASLQWELRQPPGCGRCLTPSCNLLVACDAPQRRGGCFWSFRCSDFRWSPRRRAASDTFPPASVSTRWMCSHSARASEGAAGSWGSSSAGNTPPRAKAASSSSASTGFCK